MSTRASFVRAGQVATASLVLVVSLAIPVAAAPPANDDRGDATVIGSLPYQVTLDTTEATPQAGDPDCFSGPGNPTVWYSFTPAQGGTYGVSTVGSDYDTTLLVGTPGGGGIDVIDCNDDGAPDATSVVLWDAQAGQEYLIMAGACCGGNGGQLQLQLRRDPPLPRLNVSVAPRGSVNRFGAAVVRGRLECSRAGGGGAFVEVSVKQRAGRFLIQGGSGTDARCDGFWTVRVAGSIGRFAPGDVAVRALAGACGTFGCGEDVARRTVRLTRPDR
jgi:hypothetical protein